MNTVNSVLEMYNAQSTIGSNFSFLHTDEYIDWEGKGQRFQYMKIDTNSGGNNNNDDGGCIGTAIFCGVCACIALNADTFCSCLCDDLLGNLLDCACDCCS